MPIRVLHARKIVRVDFLSMLHGEQTVWQLQKGKYLLRRPLQRAPPPSSRVFFWIPSSYTAVQWTWAPPVSDSFSGPQSVLSPPRHILFDCPWSKDSIECLNTSVSQFIPNWWLFLQAKVKYRKSEIIAKMDLLKKLKKVSWQQIFKLYWRWLPCPCH